MATRFDSEADAYRPAPMPATFVDEDRVEVAPPAGRTPSVLPAVLIGGKCPCCGFAPGTQWFCVLGGGEPIDGPHLVSALEIASWD